MKCPHCGKSISDKGINFCPYCGQSLGQLNKDLREVTRIQIEYQEAKDKAKDWEIGAAIGFGAAIALTIAAPFTFFVTLFIAVPLFILGIVSAALTAHYNNKAKKLKDQL